MISIEARLNLAFNLHSAPGVYALLLGSGLSRSAGIPTGWEVTLDLVSRLAKMRGEELVDGPEKWYTNTFGHSPGYSEILTQLCATQAERRQALRAYFEPTEEERETGRKIPQEAHKSIARLVRAGYIRVIVTTNFDTLLEQALQAEGIAPTVISTPDGVRGALPLQHEQCVVLKLHGDYRDVRIRNTEEELGAYPASLRRLLDRILDEYGLIVCGWSGEWDFALRSAFERCASRRFSTYWAARGDLAATAQRLVDFRRASIIPITDADEFFSDISNRVLALEAIRAPHPLTTEAAVAALKRYVAEDRHQVHLTELVMDEVDKVVERIQECFPDWSGRRSIDQYPEVIHELDGAMQTLLHLVATGCYWSHSTNDELWIRTLSRLANAGYIPRGQRNSYSLLDQEVCRYPAFVTFMTAAMAALARRKFDLLVLLIQTPTVLLDDEKVPASGILSAWDVMDTGTARQVYPHPEPNMHWRWPLSLHLFEQLRDPLRQVLRDETEYEEVFVRTEYVLALAYADHRLQGGTDGAIAPVGKWATSINRGPVRVLIDEIEGQGTSWPLLERGLFGGSLERLRQVVTDLNSHGLRETQRF